MRYIVLVLFAICSFSNAWGDIRETPTIETLLSSVDQDTLVVVDIDNTLFAPVQTLGTDEWFYYYLQKLKKEGMPAQKAIEKAKDLWIAIQSSSDISTLEDKTPHVINQLQNDKFIVMAMSTRDVSYADVTLRQLISLGINMKKAAPSFNTFTVEGVDRVLFRDGVLFTSNNHKGKALLAFLKQLHFTPKKIVFINDKESPLKEVEEIVEPQGIKFLGLRYSKADERVKNFRPDLADIELQFFGKVLSDEAAEALVKKEKAPIH
jgi:hypothetical protein